MAKKGGTRGARRKALESVDSESVETIHENVEMAVEPSAEDIAAATSMGLERVGTGAKNEIPGVGAVVQCRTRTYQVDDVEAADDGAAAEPSCGCSASTTTTPWDEGSTSFGNTKSTRAFSTGSPGRRSAPVLLTPGPRACLHAKCIIVDDSRILITSANLSEAAQVRNIEMGVLTDDAATVHRVVGYLQGMVVEHALVQLGGP